MFAQPYFAILCNKIKLKRSELIWDYKCAAYIISEFYNALIEILIR